MFSPNNLRLINYNSQFTFFDVGYTYYEMSKFINN